MHRDQCIIKYYLQVAYFLWAFLTGERTHVFVCLGYLNAIIIFWLFLRYFYNSVTQGESWPIFWGAGYADISSSTKEIKISKTFGRRDGYDKINLVYARWYMCNETVIELYSDICRKVQYFYYWLVRGVRRVWIKSKYG